MRVLVLDVVVQRQLHLWSSAQHPDHLIRADAQIHAGVDCHIVVVVCGNDVVVELCFFNLHAECAHHRLLEVVHPVGAGLGRVGPVLRRKRARGRSKAHVTLALVRRSVADGIADSSTVDAEGIESSVCDRDLAIQPHGVSSRYTLSSQLELVPAVSLDLIPSAHVSLSLEVTNHWHLLRARVSKSDQGLRAAEQKKEMLHFKLLSIIIEY